MSVLQLESHSTTAEVVLGLDSEWEVPMNATGYVIGPPKTISILQLACHTSDSCYLTS